MDDKPAEHEPSGKTRAAAICDEPERPALIADDEAQRKNQPAPPGDAKAARLPGAKLASEHVLLMPVHREGQKRERHHAESESQKARHTLSFSR